MESERFLYALTDAAQLVVCHPANQKVAGLLPSQGTCLGFRFGPQFRVHVRRSKSVFLTSMFLSFSFSLTSLLSRINIRKKVS